MSSIKERCQKIKLFLSDVDGVLTDAGMYYTEDGDELKKFNTLDGGGFALLKLVGIQSGFLTSEKTEIVERRARKLNIDHVVQGAKNKPAEFERLIQQLGMGPENVAYIGDDINDLALLQQVGISATVPDHFLPEGVKCDYITTRAGGSGAVRDFAEWLLRQRGEYHQALNTYLESVSSK